MALFVYSSKPCAPPAFSVIQSHCFCVRWSHQRMAGRITWFASSRATSPCIWPEKLTPAISSLGTHFTILFSPSATAFHQSSGFCSAQPGRGVYSGYSTVALAATLPVSSTAMHFAPEVPLSMPIRYLCATAAPSYFFFLRFLDSWLILWKSSRFSFPAKRRWMLERWLISAMAVRIPAKAMLHHSPQRHMQVMAK